MVKSRGVIIKKSGRTGLSRQKPERPQSKEMEKMMKTKTNTLCQQLCELNPDQYLNRLVALRKLTFVK